MYALLVRVRALAALASFVKNVAQMNAYALALASDKHQGQASSHSQKGPAPNKPLSR